jgi:hypothetical protein
LAELGDQLGGIEAALLAPGAILVETLEFGLQFLDRGIELGGGVLGLAAQLAGALDARLLLGFEVAQLLAQPLRSGDEGGEGGLAVLGEVDEALDLEPSLGGRWARRAWSICGILAISNHHCFQACSAALTLWA